MAKRILLADDSVTIQKVVELTFSEGDYQVTCVSNGKQALQALQEQRPDILLCDVIMPEVNGYEVASFVKQNPQYSGIPVVLLTGTFEPFDEDKAKHCGADTYVTKPFDSKMLVDKVEELLKKRMVLDVSAPAGPVQIFQARQEYTLEAIPPSDAAFLASEAGKAAPILPDENPFLASEPLPSVSAAAPIQAPPPPPRPTAAEAPAPSEEPAILGAFAEEEPPPIESAKPSLIAHPAPEPVQAVPTPFEAEALDLGPIEPEEGLPGAAFEEILPPPSGVAAAPEVVLPPPAQPAQPSPPQEVEVPEAPMEGEASLEEAFFEPEEVPAPPPLPPLPAEEAVPSEIIHDMMEQESLVAEALEARDEASSPEPDETGPAGDEEAAFAPMPEEELLEEAPSPIQGAFLVPPPPAADAPLSPEAEVSTELPEVPPVAEEAAWGEPEEVSTADQGIPEEVAEGGPEALSSAALLVPQEPSPEPALPQGDVFEEVPPPVAEETTEEIPPAPADSEWAEPAEATAAVAPAPVFAAAPLAKEQVEQAVRKYLQEEGADLLRQIAWEVIPELAENVIKKRIRELESTME